MSQHFFRTVGMMGTPILVFMGYDRPLGGFFLQLKNIGSEADVYLYSNLDESDSHPTTLDHFKGVLTSFEIKLPSEMLAEIYHDGQLEIGNKYVLHFNDPAHTRRELKSSEVSEIWRKASDPL